MPEDVKRFGKLFKGNQRSYGVWFPDTGQMMTQKEPYTDKNIEEHIRGKVGLGIVPVLDNNKCNFGVIDIDAHGEDEYIDLVALEAAVRKAALPLITCRSKSGGAHLYLFTLEPIPAEDIRALLSRFAKDLGYPGVEVFPKQSRLYKDSEGTQALGNWINLPYFKAHDTNRYMIQRSQNQTFDLFLTEAEAKRVSPEWVSTQILGENSEAPPCVQHMMAKGVKSYRNESLFAIAIYFRKRYKEDWIDKTHDTNRQVMEVPLPYGEVKKLLSSIRKRDYTYRCNEEPCSGLCDKDVCLTRKYGMLQDELDAINQIVGEFTDLKKIMTDPPKWEISFKGRIVMISTTSLMDFNKLRMSVLEQLTEILPPMRSGTWQRQLMELTNKCEMIEAPEEASTSGQILEKLEEFLARADLSASGETIDDRAFLTRGIPIVQVDDDDVRCVYFRGKDFTEFLKRTKSDLIRGANLWVVLRAMGVEHCRLRIPGIAVLRTWKVPINSDGHIEVVPPELVEEF